MRTFSLSLAVAVTSSCTGGIKKAVATPFLRHLVGNLVSSFSKQGYHLSNPATWDKMAARLHEQGTFSEAKALYPKVRAGQQSQMADDHPDTGLQSQLGDNRPETLRIVNGLASLLEEQGRFLMAQGRFSEAEPLLRKALAGRQSLLGDNHPDTLNNMNTLATLLVQQGRFSEAEPLLQKALAGLQSLLGDNHSDTLRNMNTLATLLVQQGRFSEAEPLLQKALAGLQSLLGDNHSDTLTIMNNLGNVLDEHGRFSEAEALLRKALAGRQSLLGDNHPDTLSSMNNLANLFEHQEKISEAEELYQKAVSGFQSSLGRNHPKSIRSMSNLESLLQHGIAHVGSGDAWRDALHDDGSVVKVEWFTVPLAGKVARLFQLKHSLLAITVADRRNRSRIYVIEKVARVHDEDNQIECPRRNDEQLNPHVIVSTWADVTSKCRPTLYDERRLDSKDLQGSLNMSTLIQFAVNSGPYELMNSNCHHLVMGVYNYCAVENARVETFPNQRLVSVLKAPSFLRRAASSAKSGESEFGSVGVRSQSVANERSVGHFAIVKGETYHSPLALDSARLAAWIYHPHQDGSRALPDGMRAEYIEMQDDDRIVQWAACIKHDTLYVTFRGTVSIQDVLVDSGAVTHDDAAHGVRVHGSMWNALHQRKHRVVDLVKEKIEEYKEQVHQIVLCGHSLGGAYAILTALALLHCECQITHVFAFGAPQVIVPDKSNQVFRTLSSITTLFVNAYDIVPRLPSCRAWINGIPKAGIIGKSIGPIKFVITERTFSKLISGYALDEYGSVGMIVFMSEGCSLVTKMASPQDGSCNEGLCTPPKTFGEFVLADHDMGAYLKILERLV